MTLTTTALRLERGRGFALEAPALELRPGEVLGLVGRNGAGKSTLLQLLSGYLRPDRGEISWDGKPFARHSRPEWARNVAVVPQEAGAVPPLTVAEYVRLGRVPFRGLLQSFTPADLAAVETALARCGLGGLSTVPLAELSGGQRQRARIARALAQGSRLLLLDEPTNHLDLAAVRDVALLVRELASEGTAFVASLHDLDVASYVTTQVAFVGAGGVETPGPTRSALTPEAVLRHLGAAVDAVPRGDGSTVFPLRYPDAALSADVAIPGASAIPDPAEPVPFAPFGDAPASGDGWEALLGGRRTARLS